MAATTAGFLSLWGASDACCRPYQLVGLDQDEPEVSRDGAGGDEATHVTIKFERAANSNFKGSRWPATARSRIILRSPLFWRVSAWTMAVTQSLGQKRSLEVTAPPDQTRRLGATTSTHLPVHALGPRIRFLQRFVRDRAERRSQRGIKTSSDGKIGMRRCRGCRHGSKAAVASMRMRGRACGRERA